LFHSYDINTKKLYYFSLSPFGFTGKIQDKKTNTIYQEIDNEINNDFFYPEEQILKTSNLTINNNNGFQINPLTTHSESIINSNDFNMVDSELSLEYVYLESKERKFFISKQHDYLIEKIYFTPDENVLSINQRFRLNINLSCKSSFYLCQLDNISKYQKFNYTNNFDFNYLNHKSINNTNDFDTNHRNNNSLILQSNLQLNSQNRIQNRNNIYFENIQPYQHSFNRLPKGVSMYSYALFPTKPEPSGTTNMSQIEYIDTQLKLSNAIDCYNTAKLRSYSIVYQLWRVQFGVSGEVFVN
jgi:hypothetical protein